VPATAPTTRPRATAAATGPPVLALVGPTAAGKSALALATAARRGDVEVVAVDAFTVYRGMDVGTATPSAEDRRRVPHHLVDVLEPEQDCTVSWFQSAARAAVDDVLARGLVPLLVGGSGLYFRAVVDDLEFPPTDPEVRAAVTARVGGDPAVAHAALAVVDPAAAATMDPANLRRAVRALEVLELTGRPFSDWRTAWDEHRSSRYPGLRVVGVAWERAALVARIAERVTAMLAGGLVEECAALRGRALSRTARQAIGYGEVLDALDGGSTMAAAHERILVRTRRYATRQLRWFRSDPRVRWHRPCEVVEVLCSST